VTSHRRQSRLYLGGWDCGRWKRNCGLRKIPKIPSRQRSLSQRFSKTAKQHFFVPTPSKKEENAKLWRTWQTSFFHVKPLSKKPSFWKLALKMPTWQPRYKKPFVKKNFRVTVYETRLTHKLLNRTTNLSSSKSVISDRYSDVASPKIFGGAKCMILGEWHYFIWKNAFQSTKWLYFPKFLGEWPL